ncbi:hypothetical protein QJS64_02550 [Paraclostridium bifermentans]|uniref:Uncharacterized protein n=1 Tax=Paraclostridium bifermentans TaxID=1490 RepID=A0ABY8R3X2_PARBF|nr:hypothetical protein QJS64_02550 [Paraclostridium bifermentans]
MGKPTKILATLFADDRAISKDDILVDISIDKSPTPRYKQRIQQIYNQFFSNEFIQDYIDFILKGNVKIYKDEMCLHLKILYMRVIDVIFTVNAQ